MPKALCQHALNAGFKGFYTGEPEVCPIEGFSEIQQKEYTRGWWLAYFKNKDK